MRIPVSAFYVVVVSFLAASCAPVNVKPDYSVKDSPGKGLLVVSLTQTAPTLSLDFRAKGGKNIETILNPGARISAGGSFDWQNPNGRLVVVELAAGQYEFMGWRSGTANQWYESKPFSIPFEVTERKATYVGAIHIDIAPTGYYKISVTDRSERDMPLLFQRFKNIKETDLIKRVSTLSQS